MSFHVNVLSPSTETAGARETLQSFGKLVVDAIFVGVVRAGHGFRAMFVTNKIRSDVKELYNSDSTKDDVLPVAYAMLQPIRCLHLTRPLGCRGGQIQIRPARFCNGKSYS